MEIKRRKKPPWLLGFVSVLKRIPTPFYAELPLYKFIRLLYRNGRMRYLSERAAALAFYLLLATPSFILCLLSVAAFIPFLTEAFNVEVLNFVQMMSPDELTYHNIEHIFTDLFELRTRSALSISLLLTFYFASNIVMVMRNAFDKSLNIEDISNRKMNRLHKRVSAFRATLLLLFFTWIGITLLILQKAFMNSLFKQWHIKDYEVLFIHKVLQVVMIIVITLITIGIIYRYIPQKRYKAPFFSAGTFFSSIIFLLLLYGFSYWVNHYISYNSIFGSLGTLIIVLSLTYSFAYIVLLGFQVNVGIKFLHKHKKDRKGKKNFHLMAKNISYELTHRTS